MIVRSCVVCGNKYAKVDMVGSVGRHCKKCYVKKMKKKQFKKKTFLG